MPKNALKTIGIFLLAAQIFFSFFHFTLFQKAAAQTASSTSLTPQTLQDAINAKAKELQAIANQIRENQANLQQTQGQSKSLQKEISSINYNIKQVNLNIAQAQTSIDKLNLEIESLGYTIGDTENQIGNQEESVETILQQIQQREGDSPLIIFLKNKSFSESIFEAQSLADLSHGLSVEIENLKDKKQDLSNEVSTKTNKKNQVLSQNQNLKNQKLILADTVQTRQQLLSQTKDKEQLYQAQITQLEKRQQDIAAEIEKIDEQLRLQINPSLLPTARPGVLGMPVTGILSQEYGATSFAKYGYRGRWHNGADFAAPIGTPVYATEAGIVLASANQDLYCYRGAYGKFIAIKHPGINLTTLYAHLSLQIVRVGDTVQKGQLIGYVGKTGYATGPHLHFGVYASPTFIIGPSKSCGPIMPFGGDLNPLNYLP